MSKTRIWTLLAVAALLSLMLAACDANELRTGDRSTDGNDGSGLLGNGDVEGRVDVNDLDLQDEVEFTGVVESMADDEWVVSDCRLLLSNETKLEYRNGDVDDANDDDDDGDDNDNDDGDDNDNGDDNDDGDDNDNDSPLAGDDEGSDWIDVGDPVKVEAWLTSDDVLVAREIKVIGRDEVDPDLLEAEDGDDDNEICLVVQNSLDRSGDGDDDDGDDDDGNGKGRGSDKGKDKDKGKGGD